MNTPTVSVVIPTFNRASLIGAAIESVLAQTYRSFEVIVVDDGSTDETPTELERFGEQIRYIQQENMGVSAARNTGIRAARGKWIAFLDSDDKWRPEKLDRQLQCLNELNVGMCFTRCVTNMGAILPDINHLSLIAKRSGLYYSEAGSGLLGQKVGPWLPSLIVEKRLLEKVGLFDESLYVAEDTWLMYQLALVSTFAYLDEPLVIVSQSSTNSLSYDADVTVAGRRLDCYLRVQEKVYRQIVELDRPAAREIRERLGYLFSRRAEVACAAGESRVARHYAGQGLFRTRDLRSFVRCIGIYTAPSFFRTKFQRKWRLLRGSGNDLNRLSDVAGPIPFNGFKEKSSAGSTWDTKRIGFEKQDENIAPQFLRNKQVQITFVSSSLPYPVSHGGLMAAHNAIQALAKSASVSVVVLVPGNCSEATIREAGDYYLKTCRSFVCHQFPHLNPSSSKLIKAWHYLSGRPRHGFWSKVADRLLAEEMRKTGCQILWCNSTHEAKYLPTAKRIGCKTVLMTHNVESDLVRQEMSAMIGISRLVSWIRWLDMRRLEKMGARCADLVTGITTVDQEYYIRLKGADRAFLLPFGYRASDNGAHPTQDREEPSTICFIGSMDWQPNVVAARYLVKEIMPLVWKTIPEAKCLIVGKNPTEEVSILASEKVTVTGTVPSVSEYYERASVIVVPVRDGSGVKIKLIEAMAAGKAVVTTSAGTAGIKVKDGAQVMIADRPQGFAKAVIDLVRNKAERERLGKEARRFVIEHLSPKETEIQVQKILQALNQL